MLIDPINVALPNGNAYPITISPGAIRTLQQSFQELPPIAEAILITDENVDEHYGDLVLNQLEKAATGNTTMFMLPPGEETKSVDNLNRLWNEIFDSGAGRDSVVFALGGGVVGDIAGFAAATYARGIRFVQIPTTLLAQVDSSVGGKVGINLPDAKNMVGAFWQPEAVIIDPDVLATLDDANYRAGLAEVVKYGVILDAEFFDFLETSIEPIEQRDPPTLAQVIRRSCQCKAKIVQMDERETRGERAKLNYGHTFGHAIETVFGYGKYLHGEAVAIGMVAAANLALALEMVDEAFCDRQKALLTSLGLPTAMPAENHDAMVQSMYHDKKAARGRPRFILPTEIGNVEIVNGVSDEQILDALRSSL